MHAPRNFVTQRSPLSSNATWPDDVPTVVVPDAVLSPQAQAAARQGVINQIRELINRLEITWQEKKAVALWLDTQTPPYAKLQRQRERLEVEIKARQANKANLRGTLRTA